MNREVENYRTAKTSKKTAIKNEEKNNKITPVYPEEEITQPNNVPIMDGASNSTVTITNNINKPTSSSPNSSSPNMPESTSAFVAFYADSQSDTDAEDQNHQRVVNYILNSGANPIFHAGDLLEDGTQESLNRFNNVTAALRAVRSFFSAPGNNERDSTVYFNNFNYPGNEHYFSLNYGNLHMIILDNYATSTAIGSAQYNWLVADLQSTASQSKITGVMFHYPVYGAGGDTKGLTNTFVPLFRNYGVDFVVSGHEHSYQKRVVDGTTYFVLSGQPSIGYMTANIYSNKVDFRVFNSNNGLIDSVTVSAR